MDRWTQPIEAISQTYWKSVYCLATRNTVSRAELWKLTVSVAGNPVNCVEAKHGIKFLKDGRIELPIKSVLPFRECICSNIELPRQPVTMKLNPMFVAYLESSHCFIGQMWVSTALVENSDCCFVVSSMI